jgi:hypothetical protein
MAKIFWMLRGGLAVLAVSMLTAIAPAQTSFGSDPAAMPKNVEDVLHQMSDQADVIFVGQVVGIRPHDDGGMAAGFVEIDFRVDQAIRGCTGGSYILREWSGLWSGDAHRYQVGKRLLMMLHAPGVTGMSSPVGGMDGAVPVRGMADASQLAAASAGAPSPVADLRWLGAKVLHSQGYRLQPELKPTPLEEFHGANEREIQGSLHCVTDDKAVRDSGGDDVLLCPPGNTKNASGLANSEVTAGELIVNPMADEDSSSRFSIPAQQASVETVVKLLGSWQRATDDAR